MNAPLDFSCTKKETQGQGRRAVKTQHLLIFQRKHRLFTYCNYLIAGFIFSQSLFKNHSVGGSTLVCSWSLTSFYLLFFLPCMWLGAVLRFTILQLHLFCRQWEIYGARVPILTTCGSHGVKMFGKGLYPQSTLVQLVPYCSSLTGPKATSGTSWNLAGPWIKGPVTWGDLSPRHVPETSRLVWHVFMQFDAATCCMNSNQFEFMQTSHAHSLVSHALVTCHCDKSVNKPIVGIPCDRRPLEKGLGTCRCNKSPCVTCMWFCRGDMSLRQVTSCDRTLINTLFRESCQHN